MQQNTNLQNRKQITCFRRRQVQLKREQYIFWFEFIGNFMCLLVFMLANTYVFLQSQVNNPFVFACVYGMLILVAQNKKCTFNLAIITVLSGQDNGLWVSVAIGSQFGGAFLASLFRFLCFKNYVNDVSYIAQTNIDAHFVVIFGEIFGSLFLYAGFIFQYDDIMGLSSDSQEQFESSHRIGIGDVLQMTSLVLFECCKDGYWLDFGTYGFTWFCHFLGHFSLWLSLGQITKTAMNNNLRL
ncbi:unnamed protein product [Paramecium octaurelia]|uniref:Aquaporin n=1 Tax=Paramecium octaurelia TaxID=43137 RepID=A0A8S1T2D4_PAROT|nr:unnamed protein product [Paramecium octaurelia]